MDLAGEIENAVPFVPGFDCDTPLSASLARQLFAQGYRFCLRYLSRGQESSQDLTDLLRDALLLGPVEHFTRKRSTGHKERKIGGLQVVVSSAIISCTRFRFFMRTVPQPREEFREPLLDAAPVLSIPISRAFEQADGIHHGSEETAFNDAGAAAGVDAGDALRILQIWIHSRHRIEKPSAEEEAGARGVALVSCAAVGQRESTRLIGHAGHFRVVGNFGRFGIAFSVMADVGKVSGGAGVEPEIGHLAHIVMIVTAGREGSFVRHGERFLRQGTVRSTPNRDEHWILRVVLGEMPLLQQQLRIEK